MEKSSLILLAFTLFQVTVEELTSNNDCLTNRDTSRALKISLRSVRNQTGDWVDIFTAKAEYSNSSDSINVDVMHKVIQCQGKRVVYIQGISKGNPEQISEVNREAPSKLTFHPRCGKHVAIMSNGRTVQKIKLDDANYSAVFTNRPLKDNEIFEVKLDKENKEIPHSVAIGVVTRTPADIDILPDMYKSSFAEIYIWAEFHSNGKAKSKYGRNIQGLKIGDKVGVMRSQYGTLQFFVNGVDQGPAASNVPSPVYGIFDLRGTASMATIVDES